MTVCTQQIHNITYQSPVILDSTTVGNCKVAASRRQSNGWLTRGGRHPSQKQGQKWNLQV